MAYQSVKLDSELSIEKIYTIHYYEYQNDFYFSGERHNFWEFQCVDKGSAEIVTDNGSHILNRSQVIFHRPNEFHTLKAAGRTAPNIIVISFSCDSPCMNFFENKVLEFSDTERSILGRIIAEARNCFASPLDTPYLEKMEKKDDIPFGAQKLLTLYLEELLIHVIRRYTMAHYSASAGIYDSCQSTSEACRNIIHYLEQHIRESMTIDGISKSNIIGRSQLQKLFRDQYQCGVIEFFSRMKIDFAKQLIRENDMNFTQISDFLGYSSIHYFSRQFKKLSGMTPTEYATSIKAISSFRSLIPEYRGYKTVEYKIRQSDKEENMHICKVKNYQELSRKAANLIAAQVILKPDSVLGLATGSSPVGTYNHLVEMYENGDLDFSQVTTVNLDEYKGLSGSNEQSYRYFMNTHLFHKININHANTYVPNGTEPDAREACSAYNELLHKIGPADIQILGLGHDGHIGFNEPSDHFEDETHCVDLTETTIQANKRFFESEADVPRQAYTMGIGTIMRCKKILVVVSGSDKAQILKKVVQGPVTPQVPGSILQFHPDCTIIADEAALSEMDI